MPRSKRRRKGGEQQCAGLSSATPMQEAKANAVDVQDAVLGIVPSLVHGIDARNNAVQTHQTAVQRRAADTRECGDCS